MFPRKIWNINITHGQTHYRFGMSDISGNSIFKKLVNFSVTVFKEFRNTMTK